MTHPITIDEMEEEIEYLREQNQKLIKELSQLVKENIGFREEITLERRRLHQILGEVGEMDLNENNHNRQRGGGEEGDLFYLNRGTSLTTIDFFHRLILLSFFP